MTDDASRSRQIAAEPLPAYKWTKIGMIEVNETHRGPYLWVKESDADRLRDALQARIDELMLEYCPDEMTEEQTARWAASQRPI